MPSPYGLDLAESCSSCRLHEDRLFCGLGRDANAALNVVKFTAAYPKGALRFVEGQSPRGVFVLCAGRVKQFTSRAPPEALAVS